MRESPENCHLDCQVTEHCLGWFYGPVGGVKSCVLYGCGDFKEIEQENAISCKVGDCLGNECIPFELTSKYMIFRWLVRRPIQM